MWLVDPRAGGYEGVVKQSKKQPAQTRLALLEATGQEFSRNGYSGSGLGTIVVRAGLTKGALFHHFPDKLSLAGAWVREWLAPEIERVWVQPLSGVDSLESLKSFCRARALEMSVGDALPMLVSLQAEISESQPSLGDELESLLAEVRSAVASLLERGKSAQWVHRSIQPMVEASFLVSVFCGFSVTTRCRDAGSARSVCATAVEAYLETLRPA